MSSAASVCCLFLTLSFSLVLVSNGLVAPREKVSEHEQKINAALRDFERALSGKPINCRRFVDLFPADGQWTSPAGRSVGDASKIAIKLKGQRLMHKQCENGRIFGGFEQVETFISGPHHISGYSVAFPRTILLVVKDTPCRITWQGHSVLHFGDDYRILHWEDYWNEEEFEEQWKGCQWSKEEGPAEEETGAKASLHIKEDL